MLPKKGMFLAAILVLVSVLISFGCRAPAPASKPAPTTSAPTLQPTQTQPTTPQYGGTIKVIAPPGVTNLGYPGKAQGPSDPTYLRPAVEFLLSYDSKGTGYAPELATSWEFSPDYKSITLHLRKGVKFQDGTDFNAEAVKYNLDLHRTGVRTEIKPVASVDIIDDYTVRLNLSAYDVGILTGLCAPTGWIVSPASLKKLGDEALLHPVGTGPFKFVSYERDVSLKYEKWDGYWQKGKPYLDSLEFVFVKDPVTSLASFKAGEAQVILTVAAKDVAGLQATGKYNLVRYPGQLFGLAGDSAHPDSPFSKIKVRQAIAYAIDSAAIAKAVGFGLYEATNQFAVPGAPVYNPAVVGYPFNPQKAKQLLSEAGYPSGFETTILFDATSDDQKNMFSAIQGYLNEVGIKGKLDAADPARFRQVTSEGWNNQLVFFWTAVAKGLDMATQLRAYLSSKAFRYSTKSLYIPADYDAKYAQASVETNPEKAVEQFKALRKIITDDYCLAIPVMIPYSFLAKTVQVKDFDKSEYAANEWRPENAWLSK